MTYKTDALNSMCFQIVNGKDAEAAAHNGSDNEKGGDEKEETIKHYV